MSEEFVVYILRSLSTPGKTYTGMTGDLIGRVKSHNLSGTKGYTLHYRPWEVIHVEFFTSKSGALKHERFLKSGRGRDTIRQLMNSGYVR